MSDVCEVIGMESDSDRFSAGEGDVVYRGRFRTRIERGCIVYDGI